MLIEIGRRSGPDFLHGSTSAAWALARRNCEQTVKGAADSVPDADWRHDMKNQLGIVLGYAELILHGMDQSNPMRSDVEEIMKAGQHALTLVRQLEPAD
jgi:hypothetical protein